MDLWRQTDSAYTNLLKRWKINLNTLWVIEYLHDHPEENVEPAMLAETTHMFRQTINVILNDLEDHGYLRRLPHPQDRRRKLIKLTKRGENFCIKVLGELEKIELASIMSMTESEQLQLIELSRRFYESIARAAEEKPMRRVIKTG